MGSSNCVSLAPIPDVSDISMSRFVVSGAGTIAGVANKRIWVFGAYLVAGIGGATVVPYDSGATVAQSGTIVLAAGTPMVLPYQQYPWWTVGTGNALIFSVSGSLGGDVIYVQG